MKTLHARYSQLSPRSARGFSLVELLVALVLGLVMMAAFGALYFSSKTASRRVDQLSTMQNSVRTAFEYLTNDAHAVGLTGCHQGRTSGYTPLISTNLADNHGVAVEGYDASLNPPTYPLVTTQTPSWWHANIAAGTLPVFDPTVAGATTTLTGGSDVLFLRTTGSRPLRLALNSTPSLVTIENAALSGVCSDNSARTGGFCPGSWALVASCTNAQMFRVATVASGGSTVTLTPTASTQLTTTYTAGIAEVFPLQTIMYYVRPGSRAGTHSLYRRVFDGDDGTTNGEEQELIEDVETLQVTYGVDTTPASPRDFAVDAYVTANNVTDWSRVIAVRMSVLMRARDPIQDTEASVAASLPVDGVNVTFPTTGDKYDRRVFTTTVALRNRIANF